MGVRVDQAGEEDGAGTIDDTGSGAVHGAAHVRGSANGDDATARGSERAVLDDQHLSLRTAGQRAAAGMSVQKGSPTSGCAPCSTPATTSCAARAMAASAGVW